MATLTEEIQTFIVQRLAMYDTPTEVVEAVKSEYGLTLARQQVYNYDPGKAGQKPTQRWIDLHAATRKAFLEETTKLPVAHRAVRIKELQGLYAGAKKSGNRVLAAALLKQIAEEVGDAYTNRRVLAGSIGTIDLSTATDEQLERIAAGDDPAKVMAAPRAA